jgi:hypothetical protein
VRLGEYRPLSSSGGWYHVAKESGVFTPPPLSIEQIGPDLPGLVQNGPDQDKAGFLCVEHRMRLKAEATKTERDLIDSPPNAGEVGDQVERALKPGLLGSECLLGVIINLDKITFRPFRKAEVSLGEQLRADARCQHIRHVRLADTLDIGRLQGLPIAGKLLVAGQCLPRRELFLGRRQRGRKGTRRGFGHGRILSQMGTSRNLFADQR